MQISITLLFPSVVCLFTFPQIFLVLCSVLFFIPRLPFFEHMKHTHFVFSFWLFWYFHFFTSLTLWLFLFTLTHGGFFPCVFGGWLWASVPWNFGTWVLCVIPQRIYRCISLPLLGTVKSGAHSVWGVCVFWVFILVTQVALTLSSDLKSKYMR